MNEKYNALFTPWKIGNVEIKNRIVQCSMGGTSLFGWMEPNHFDKEAAYFLLNRAQDGVGLILPGMQCIRDPLGIPGRKWLYQNDQMFKQLKEYMVEFHKTGAKLFIQLAAGMGRSMAINGWMTKLAKNNVLNKIASPIVDVQYICASASEVPNRWKEDVMSRPLTVKEIEDMVYAFGQTAKKLRAAGVDGVEIHAVHEGYLLDQFTMKNWKNILMMVFLILFPMILIILQRETGSALVYTAFFLVLYREGMPGVVLFSGLCAVVYFVVGIRFDQVFIADTPTPIGEFAVLSMVLLSAAGMEFL